jgi:membrane protease YdiL (CAAX protease family)
MAIYDLSSVYAWGMAFTSLVIIFFALRFAFNQQISKGKRFAFSIGLALLQTVMEIVVFAGLALALGEDQHQNTLSLLLAGKGMGALIVCVVMAIFVALVLLCEKLFGKKPIAQATGTSINDGTPQI